MSAARKAKIIAAEIPALVTSKIPVSTPTRPVLSASPRAPFTRAFPKLLIGTEAPAPANWIKGSYIPRPPSTAPPTTSVTVIWAGVSLNTSINSCPITQMAPPIRKEKINCCTLMHAPHSQLLRREQCRECSPFADKKGAKAMLL